MITELSGQIERITFTNEENGYTIGKLKVPGRQDLVTIVGTIMAPAPGEVLKLRGQWVQHPKYGLQFNVIEYHTEVPATVNGIRKYLGSGLIKGLGPVMADRIVSKFGDKTLQIIESQIKRLMEVDGIGHKRLQMIQQAWIDQKDIRDVMLFLQSHEIGPGYAAKIFKQYGNRSIAVVTNNPYRLASDIFGIGFLTADKIARNLGFLDDSPQRVAAGVLYFLNQKTEVGHVFFPLESLVDNASAMLGVPREAIHNAIAQLAKEQKIVHENLKDIPEISATGSPAIYLRLYHVCEVGIARRLKGLQATGKSIRTVNTARAVEWVQQRLNFTLAVNQVKAIRCALQEKVTVITGGPGTGKTTIINAVLKIFRKMRVGVLLAAPTGRAAKRLSEAAGHEARTIHRMLEYSLKKGGFQRNVDRPLDCDALVIDEVSMIDTILMYNLLNAVPHYATLIFVGDVNQLPSVGAGDVLKDLIVSDTIPIVRLTDIFRQARQSQIVVNAHRINSGQMPQLNNHGAQQNDFFFIQQEKPEQVVQTIIELNQMRIPKGFGMDARNDIQVLTPMHKGLVGAGNLNRQLQLRLNPDGREVVRGERHFRVNDKVMQIRNNYDKDVFNGDIGYIEHIVVEDQEVVVSFDNRKVVYDYVELDELVLAYAISIHKSQGSEYPAVIVPIVTQHYILLQRNLIYTAVTRGKRLVVIVGTKRALAIAINNDKTSRRYTHLKHRLRAG